MAIRNRKDSTLSGIDINMGKPLQFKGMDGDVSFNITKDGIGLYGKLNGEWYRFGIGNIIGWNGKPDTKRKIFRQNLIGKELDLSKKLKIGRSTMTIGEQSNPLAVSTDLLSISSQVFQIDSTGGDSTLYIGDISLQTTWGTAGATITLPGASNNSSKPLIITGGTSTGGSSAGGNFYIAPGASAGGNNGSLYLGHNGTSIVNPFTTNIYGSTITLDCAGDIEINADGGDVTFKDASADLATINGTGLKIDNIASSSSSSFLTENSGVVEKRSLPTAAVTALNSATANELVTVGATTTELDAETNATFDGNTLSITNTQLLLNQAVFKYDGSNHFGINVISTGASILSATGDITFKVLGDCINFSDGTNTFAEIYVGTASTFRLISNTDYALNLETLGTGDINILPAGGDILSYSVTASKPTLTLDNRTVDASAPSLIFNSQRGHSGTGNLVDAVDDDVLGDILFTGYDDGTPSTHTYAKIRVIAADTLTNEEKGNLAITISSKDGNLYEACTFAGNEVAGGAITTTLGGPLYLKEPATGAAEADVNNYGQIWAKNDTPTSLYFTGDTGVDVQLTDGADALGQVKVVTVTISEAEMDALHSTEKVLVAAQGANMVVVPVKIVTFTDRDASTAQSVNTAMWFGVNGSTSASGGLWGYHKGFMRLESGDRVHNWLQVSGETMSAAMTTGDNQPLTAKMNAAITSGSIDSCKVSVTYYVFDNS